MEERTNVWRCNDEASRESEASEHLARNVYLEYLGVSRVCFGCVLNGKVG